MIKRLKSLIDADPSGELPLIVSDKLPHYKTVLRESLTKLKFCPRTGRLERPRKARRDPNRGPHLHYAVVKKDRKGGKIVKVTRMMVFGTLVGCMARLENSPSRTINTSHVERFNGSIRFCDSHLTRKSPCFAKSKRWLNAKLELFPAVNNFVRPHGTLIKKKGGAGRSTSPAIASNLTDHLWSHFELMLSCHYFLSS
jgi:hypothetical protein